MARKESATRLNAIVGRRVAELRRARGWTQERMAERLGSSVQWLSRIEGGGENLTIDTLVGLGNVLGTAVVELLTPGAEDEPRRHVRPRGRPTKGS